MATQMLSPINPGANSATLDAGTPISVPRGQGRLSDGVTAKVRDFSAAVLLNYVDAGADTTTHTEA
jgi:hypothetical protein